MDPSRFSCRGYGGSVPAVSTLGNPCGPLLATMSLRPYGRVRGTRPGELSVTIPARVTEPDANALAVLAHRNGCSNAAIIRGLLSNGLAPWVDS
jgi:hypothetical protein